MSASFHNVQGWLRWYRVHNTVEVVALGFGLFLLVSTQDSESSTALRTILVGICVLLQAGNRRNLLRFLSRPVLTAPVEDVIDAPVEPGSGERMTLLENGIHALAVLFLALSCYYLVASWVDVFLLNRQFSGTPFGNLHALLSFLISCGWVVSAAPLLVFLVRQFGVRVESDPS